MNLHCDSNEMYVIKNYLFFPNSSCGMFYILIDFHAMPTRSILLYYKRENVCDLMFAFTQTRQNRL